MVNQEEIHNLCLSNDEYERIYALKQIGQFFSFMPNKQQVWSDLHNLICDNYRGVRSSAAEAIGSAFPHIPDKQQAWIDLLRLTNDYEFHYVRTDAAYALVSAFSHMPDKQQAWNGLLSLTSNDISDVRSIGAKALGSAFSHVPDKQKAWDDLLRLTKRSSDEDVAFSAGSALGSAFSYVPDKQKAWDDLHRLTNDEDSSVRAWAAKALGSAFSQVPDKQQAWDDLHRLSFDVMESSAIALGSAFPHVPDKAQAWNDLHRLTNDSNYYVRSNAVEALASVFAEVPEKQQAWDDLLRLTNDREHLIICKAGSALGSAVSKVPDKQQAWKDLLKLINGEGSSVRYNAASALGSAFSQMPDKQQAWDDLHRLINDKYSYVRLGVSEALGSAYSQLPDKQQAWKDLLRLTNDEESYVRSSSYHSLGRVCIFMASQAESDEDYKEKLEKAIEFFKEAALESLDKKSNPSKFCLPFYRSFHTILFKNYEVEKRVDRYLTEAKNAIGDSKSKELFFEAVENLANALKEVQSIGNLDLETKKCELNFYSKYCDHAAELMRDTDEKAPFATEVLRRGLPLLDRNLKKLFEEIQKKAKSVCQVSQGTATEEIACAVNREVQKWEIGNQEEMTRYVENLIFSLKSKIPNIPENKNIYERIDILINEKDLTKQYEILPILISLIPQITPEIGDKIKNAGGSMGTRVLLVTATKVESKAVLDIFQKTTGKEPYLMPINDQIYHDIGSVNGNSVTLVQSEMGSGGLGASLLTVQKAITDLSPDEVIMVGIAFGIDHKKQSIGDILVSKQLMLYELQRVGTKDGNPKIISRGDKAPASTRLLGYFRSVEVHWDESKCKINFGLILSGEKLVDNIDFRQQLCDLYPETIGGEMEGAGLYVACHDKKVDWIIVKAICDWADGNKGENKEVKQELAAKNAASFVLHMLQLVTLSKKPVSNENDQKLIHALKNEIFNQLFSIYVNIDNFNSDLFNAYKKNEHLDRKHVIDYYTKRSSDIKDIQCTSTYRYFDRVLEAFMHEIKLQSEELKIKSSYESYFYFAVTPTYDIKKQLDNFLKMNSNLTISGALRSLINSTLLDYNEIIRQLNSNSLNIDINTLSNFISKPINTQEDLDDAVILYNVLSSTKTKILITFLYHYEASLFEQIDHLGSSLFHMS